MEIQHRNQWWVKYYYLVNDYLAYHKFNGSDKLRLSLAHLLFGKPKEQVAVKTRLGYYIIVDLKEKISIGRCIYYDGQWEPYILNYMRKILKDGNIVIDVGANIGVMAFLAASLGCNVFAYEPCSENYDKLILANGIYRRGIYIYKKAISNEIGEVILYKPYNDNDSITLNCEDKSKQKEYAQCSKLDNEFFYKDKPHFEITLLKIDIEGNDYNVLLGAEKLIKAGKILNIIAEVKPETLKDIVSFLDENNYELGVLMEDRQDEKPNGYILDYFNKTTPANHGNIWARLRKN